MMARYSKLLDLSSPARSGRQIDSFGAFKGALASSAILTATDPIVSIRFPEDGELRSRKVVSRSRARPTFKYPSLKMGRMLQAESPHELNAMRLLDADPAVSSFHEQPLEIKFIMDGEVRRHIPDLMVHYGNAVELWEIKSDQAAVDSETEVRTAVLTEALGSHGYGYRLVLGTDLTRGPRLFNALTLLKYGREVVAPMEREQLRLLFVAAGNVRWDHAAGEPNEQLRRKQICRLILEGAISFDTDQFIRGSTNLTWVGSTLKSAEM